MHLANYIVCSKKLEGKGFDLVYDGDKCALASRSDGEVALDVVFNSNVLHVETTVAQGKTQCFRRNNDNARGQRNGNGCRREAMRHASALPLATRSPLFDTIQRITRDPASRTRLTSSMRMVCLSFFEEKPTLSAEPHRDSSSNHPIDQIGGVI